MEADCIIDVADFQSALDAADKARKSGDVGLTRQEYGKALSLYHGDLMPGC